jgi:ATP-dependent DNA ligase
VVLDGEILIWQRGAAPAPFADLQNAWAARGVGPAAGRTAGRDGGLRLAGTGWRDLRDLPQHERRALLEN